MGKPYGHMYQFSGTGNSTGTMVCAACNQPIFNHAHDWMSYKKTKNYDWGFVCFHRKCYKDQTGWEKIEASRLKSETRHADRIEKLQVLAKSLGITDGLGFADLAAEALGVDLEDVYYS